MTRRFAATLAVALASNLASAADLQPPASLQVDGVPPIPAELAQALKPYGEFRPHALWSWHPVRREMLVRRRLDATNQVHLVTEPGTTPQPLTDLPNAVQLAAFEPSRGEYAVYSVGEGGNEVFRLHRLDLATRESTPLSPAGERTAAIAFTRAGDRLAYTTLLVDRNNPDRTARTTLHVIDPRKPASDRIVARLDGGGWEDLHFSEDGKRLAFIEHVSANEAHVWVMEVATGRKRRVSRVAKGEQVAYAEPTFTRDGRSLLLTSDRGSEFKRLALLDIATGKERVLTERIERDVDEFALSIEHDRVAFTTNENGSHVLRFLDTRTWKELPRPALVDGVIANLRWRRAVAELGFSVTSHRSAGDVFSYDLKANRVMRWTNGNSPQLNALDFPEPSLARWKSFDDREITGFLYKPPAKFTGKRPVIINIHGGPESQAKAGFLGRNNYFVTELGMAVIYPNVRGSTGYGKTFLKLDDGRLREDSVKDIGALLDWIATQPALDPERVLVMGGSYGGYMSMAVATLYPDRIAGAVTSVGISNFVTFLERTESYRRDRRRVEYGDERDPEMRAFLESIAPVNRADRLRRPMLVAQGRNDPRVPYTEAEQIVASLKQRGMPVWFLMASDEGHGFAKRPNADYLFCAIVEFARRALMPAEPPATGGTSSGS